MTDPNPGAHFAERLADAQRERDRLAKENADLREFIAASEEVAKADDALWFYQENERMRGAFERLIKQLNADGSVSFDFTGCEWCGSVLPKDDREDTAVTMERVRRHVEICDKHPLPQVRRALAAVQADSNVTLEQRRKAEQDRELALFAMLELARELERTRAKVLEVNAEIFDHGYWHACSGCHESNEGHPTGPYSSALRCNLGVGCHECGGIGAVWEQTEAQPSVLDEMLASLESKPAAVPEVEIPQSLVDAMLESEES